MRSPLDQFQSVFLRLTLDLINKLRLDVYFATETEVNTTFNFSDIKLPRSTGSTKWNRGSDNIYAVQSVPISHKRNLFRTLYPNQTDICGGQSLPSSVWPEQRCSTMDIRVRLLTSSTTKHMKSSSASVSRMKVTMYLLLKLIKSPNFWNDAFSCLPLSQTSVTRNTGWKTSITEKYVTLDLLIQMWVQNYMLQFSRNAVKWPSFRAYFRCNSIQNWS